MPKLKITVVQPDVFWENTGANLAHLEEELSTEESRDVIILPEMFNTGFSMTADRLAEPVNFTTHKWMKMQAAQHNALVMGSFIAKEADKFYNRALWVYPDGEYGEYNKAHLFRMTDEHLHFARGRQKRIFAWKGWKILPMICYDLRFPGWSRNAYIKSKDHFYYDLLIYMSNWPAARINAWDTLLRARAIENSCFVVGVNRTGKDGKDIDFNGHSAVVDPRGNYLLEPAEGEWVKTVELDLEELKAYRQKFPVHLDW